jgi:hypothetical protein
MAGRFEVLLNGTLKQRPSETEFVAVGGPLGGRSAHPIRHHVVLSLAGSFTSSGTAFGFNLFYNLVLGPNLFRDQYRVAETQGNGLSVNGLAYNAFSLDLFTTSNTVNSTPQFRGVASPQNMRLAPL